MKGYSVITSKEAESDIANLKRYMEHKLKAPETASDYIKRLKAILQKLSYLANTIGANAYVQAMFGANARHITFKKMAIIYFIEDNTVYIQRIIPGSLIN